MLRFSRFLLALTLATAAPTVAQGPLLQQLRPAPDSVPKASPLPAPTTSFAPLDIPLQAGLTIARLSEVAALMTPVRSVVEVERVAGPVLDSLNALANRQLTLPSSQVTRRALNDLANEWERRRVLVGGWIKAVRTRNAALDSVRNELEADRALWQRTLERARREGVSAELVAEAEQVKQQLDIQDRAILARLRQLVDVELVLIRARLTVDTGQAAVDEALQRQRRQLLRIDGPSLWAQVAGGDLPSLRETMRTHWGMAADALRAFIEMERGRVIWHLLGTALLLLGTLALRRSTGWPDGDNVHQISGDERWLLQHPLAATLLIAFLGTAILNPRAPSAVYDLIMLAAALALLRVMPSLLPDELQRAGRRGTMLFVIDRLATIMLHSTPWHRVASIGVTIAGLTLCGIAIRRYHHLDPARRRRPGLRWLYRGLLLASVLFGTAIVANLAGNVTLALVLTPGVISLFFFGILLFAGVRIADGIVSVGVRVTADDLRFVELHGAAITTRVTQLLQIAAFGTWLIAALVIFYLADPVRDALAGLLGASWSIGQAKFSLAGILVFFATIWVGALVGRWVAIFLEADVLDRLDLPRGVPVTIASIVRYTLTAIAFFLALAAVGVDVGQLAIIGGALSVGVGFGLQTIVHNFISGLILAFERPLAVGDTIQIGELEGQVRQIGIRASVVRTFQGADVIVPNGQLISNEVINWTRSDRTRRLEIPVGVAYGTDPGSVISLLTEVAAGQERVRVQPAPVCLFQGFGESSLEFVLRFWTEADDFPVVRSNVRVAVHGALKAAGIEIPYPQRDLHLRSVGQDAARALVTGPKLPDTA